MSDNLKKKTLTALIWSFVDKFGQQFLYFVTGIILAIPLNPVDLGKMARCSAPGGMFARGKLRRNGRTEGKPWHSERS